MNLNKLTAARPLLFLLSATLLASCYNYREKERIPTTTTDPNQIRAEAYVPVYGVDSVIRGIKRLAARPTVNAGKIYVYGSYLFQVEKLKGIHVIDYSDKKNPAKIAFITCEGSSEIAVKNGYLITNNLDDLVTIDISRKEDAKEVGRIKHAFPHYNWEAMMLRNHIPPQRGVWYVCPAYFKGDIIAWKLEKNVLNAHCQN